MKNLPNIGRVFYGIAIFVIGLYTIYYKDFHPYLLPANHSWLPGIAVFAYTFGALLTLAGVCIVFKKKTGPVSLLLGAVLLLIVCFYYIPYELIAATNYMHLGEWENAEKEFALAGGAFVIAGCFPEKKETPITRFLGKLLPFGTVSFSLMIIGFGILHFVYAKEAADYVPSWVPNHIFWMYFCGASLLCSGIGIIVNVKRRLAAVLLGSMIFTWFIILHTPRMIAAPSADLGDEAVSAFLALAYSGTAFIIAGATSSWKRSQQRENEKSL